MYVSNSTTEKFWQWLTILFYDIHELSEINNNNLSKYIIK